MDRDIKYRQFCKLVSLGIRRDNDTKILSIEESMNWDEMYKMAKVHDIIGILYYGMYNTKSLNFIPKGIRDQMKLSTIGKNIYQIEFIKTIAKIINVFNEDLIDVILLKGLILRNYYPKPELRTMGDADILIKKKDLKNVEDVLVSCGFKFKDETSVDVSYENDRDFRIEVHWKLIDGEKDNIFETIWDDVIELDFYGTKAYAMTPTDMLTYQFIHLSKHKKEKGFGVRQLSDLVVLIESEYNNIDWKKFKYNIEKVKLEKFVQATFFICNKLLQLTIPQVFINLIDDNDKYIDELINYIISGGVHGRADGSDFLIRKSRMTLYITIEELAYRYKYVIKYPILIPMAWVHRIIDWIFDDSFTFKDKIKYLIKGKIEKKKEMNLNKWLEV